tara:strand:+ start:229 stop:474 length:246 start_codon:yes stop_codon:yes gene_type:complete
MKQRIKKIIDRVILENEEESLEALRIDYSKAYGGDAVTDAPEVIDHATGKVIKIEDRMIQIEESTFRNVVREVMRKSLDRP